MLTRNSTLRGAVAGLAGAYLMQWFRSAWNRHYASAPEHEVFGLDKEADVKSVDKLTTMFAGRVLSERRSERIALVLHYAYGMAAGAAYSIGSQKFPAAKFGYGALFGTAVWVLGDEVPITLLKISNPCQRSHRSHASAFVAHLIFGTVTELTLSAQQALFIN